MVQPTDAEAWLELDMYESDNVVLFATNIHEFSCNSYYFAISHVGTMQNSVARD
jgi:hypothetical protein